MLLRKRCNVHCVKSVQRRSFPGPHFPAFGLNTEGVSPSIQSECRKIRTRKNSVFGHFSRSGSSFNTVGQNICRLFQVLTQIPVTKIQTELDYYQQFP